MNQEKNEKITNMNVRKAKILVDGDWIDINPIDIKKEMIFKLFEPDGTPIVYKGAEVFVASEDSFIREDGVGQTNFYDPAEIIEIK